MAEKREGAHSFFQTVYEDSENFDTIRFMTEVEARFKSDDLVNEVRWRLDVLNDITGLPGLENVSTTLRDRLTRIFSGGGDEQAVLGQLKELTEIKGPGGEVIALKSFIKREDRRVFSEGEYKQIVGKKIANTQAHVVNLIAYYPEAERDLHKLSDTIGQLRKKTVDPVASAKEVKTLEDQIRNTGQFGLYEDLKSRFLTDWLSRFTNASNEDLEGLTPEDIQQLIQEHQRHQMTHLLKSKIKQVETDMSGQLGLHDTLEGEFRDQEFWRGVNVAGKTGFIRWVMDVVQAFGMLKGQRYAFFQSEDDKELYLLFGLGFTELPDGSTEPIRMIPYIKPFTRKGTYLLEIRKRDIGDSEQYYHELLHYTLPFVFAFDQMPDFNIRNELTSFFTSRY